LREFFRKLITSGTRESNMRFIALHSTLLVSYVWAGISIATGAVQDLPFGLVTFLGIAITGEVAQKYMENQGKDKNE